MKKLSLFLTGLLFLGIAAFGQTAIKLEEVRSHIGDSVSVCGKVFSTNYLPDTRESPTFLNMGAPYPNDSLTVLIWKNTRTRFPYKPEEKLLNKQICVTGKIVNYKGKPQIVIHKEEQIQIKD